MILIHNSSYSKIQDKIENSININTLDDYVQKFMNDILKKMKRCIASTKINEQILRNNTFRTTEEKSSL